MNEAFAARPPKRSELTAGAIQLRGLAQTLDQARTGGLAEHDESLGRAAADALLPLGTVFEVVLPDRSSCFVRRGRFLGSGGTAFVCAVEFLTGSAGPVHSEVAAKFLYKQVSGGIDLSAAERTLATNFFQELDAHRTLTALRSVEELHTMGLGVAHGAYPLRRSQSSPDVRTTEVMFQGQTALVVMPLTMLVLPLLGPDLFDLYFEQVSPAVLKSLVFQTVHTVANLHSLGYGHGDLKPENFAVDIRSGAIKLIDFSSLAPLNVRRKISGQWTQTFASPEKFRALCARAPFAIADTDDAWSLGVALYRILSHLPHPYVSEVDLPAFEAQGLLGAEHRLDEFIMPQPWKERLTAIETRQELLQIVKLLVHPEPTRRWTPRRLVREHPFFQEQKEN
ncbi:calcium-dependent protein kinase [Besnoitia besnoiti]|uniref:Calcium-dependent protein kinase n=1 Tax=Besnoitia besnoiti TaxID=94643 RepID=A0A2A9ME50_BESBE|nr:calcium-dependent protein kinase [Besnoitia besnoiti]PFH34226.1 calcium-dependent protein kinase [Besnoitia besnoiti]